MIIEKKFGGKLPVGAWGSPPPGEITDENYRAVKEAGIDFLCTLYELGDAALNESALAAAERQGVKLILNDRTFFFDGGISREEGERKIAAYKKHGSFLGISLCDEPGMKDYDRLAALIREYAPAMGGCEFYTNLMPMYASSGQLQNGWFTNDGQAEFTDYVRYISEFAAKVPVNMLSYDFYPFRKDYGWTDGNFFRQLALGRKYAAEMGVPLWVFIQATSWMKGEIRTMTETEIRWQVNASLACGARGIQYFTYITPIDDGGERFDDAMVDRNLQKTALYDAVACTNRAIRPAGDALMNYRHVGVLAEGDLPAEVPGEEIAREFGVRAEGDSYLAGCFVRGKSRALYLMNPSLHRSAEYRVNFGSGGNPRRVCLEAGAAALIEEEKE